MTRLLVVGGLAVGLAACSGSSNKEAEGPDHEDDMAQAEALGEERPISEREPEDPNSLPPTKGQPKSTSPDYEVQYGDCEALAAQYRRAWEADEYKKLEGQKFNDKQRAQAEANVKRESQEAQDNWLSACKGLVGSPYPRERLDCAMKQKSVKLFDDCWDGKMDKGGKE
jgi:hypothetical protein